jgi:hypothetical protein
VRLRWLNPFAEYPRVPHIADVNRDGHPDLISQVEFGTIEFWFGTADGIPPQSSKRLDLGRKDNLVFIDAADLNKDGWLDLILPNRSLGKNAEVSSFVYYGSADGYANDRREELPSKGSYEVSVADLNKDSWLDLFITSYKGNFARNFPSTIYWGGSNGFKQRPHTDIPTLAASGIETADYDVDGWIDLLISNHRSDGSSERPGPHDHRAASMLYWGGKDGYSPEARWDFVANGPHAMNVRDVGNGVDRGLYEDYISPAHQVSNGEHAARLRWEAETPLGTIVKFQLRAADTKDGLDKASWRGPKGADSWFTSADSELEGLDGAWIQYRARLTTPNGGPTPYLKSVTVQFRK